MTIGLILASVLAAQAPSPPEHPNAYEPPPAPVSPAWSVKTSPVVQLMADPDTFPIMRKHLPRIVDQLEYGTGIRVTLEFTLEHFLVVPESQVTREILDKIQADLDAVNAMRGYGPSQPVEDGPSQ